METMMMSSLECDETKSQYQVRVSHQSATR